MKNKFYCFRDLEYKSQPESSYWCWAACLSQMIIGLKAPSNFGRTQCELVTEYRSKFIDFKNHSCCANDNSIPKGCDLPLKENDLEKVYDESGFITKEISVHNLNSYDFIKTTLIDCQSPIVLKVRVDGSNAHMNLITGYGEKNGCKYVLITDPQKTVGESYYKMDEFIKKISVDRAWTTEVRDENLKPDQLLEASLNLIEQFISKYEEDIFAIARTKELNIDALMDKWSYLSYKNPAYLAQLINELLNKEIRDESKLLEVLELLSNDNEQRKETSCWTYINKDFYELRDLNYIDEARLSMGVTDKDETVLSRINKGNAFSKIKDYAITIEIRIIENTIQVKPVRFPMNYKLDAKWQSYNDFNLSLIHLPKIEYFTEDRNRPTGKEGMLAI